jgi:hypothetical protein
MEFEQEGDEEGVISSDNYDDDDEHSQELMPQLLPVEGEPMPKGSREPMTANEYLLQVRWEANSLRNHNFVATNVQNVIEKEIKNDYTPKSFLFGHFGAGLNLKHVLSDVDPNFRKLITQEFEFLKEELDKLRHKGSDYGKYIEYAADTNPYSMAFDITNLRKKSGWASMFNEQDVSKRIEPIMSILVRIDIEVAEQLLDWICDQLMEMDEKNEVLNDHQTKWIYSLMSLFDKPLISDTCAMLSEILTGLIKVIHKVEEACKTETNINNTYQLHSYTGGYKMLVIIIIDYFEQKYQKLGD